MKLFRSPHKRRKNPGAKPRERDVVKDLVDALRELGLGKLADQEQVVKDQRKAAKEKKGKQKQVDVSMTPVKDTPGKAKDTSGLVQEVEGMLEKLERRGRRGRSSRRRERARSSSSSGASSSSASRSASASSASSDSSAPEHRRGRGQRSERAMYKRLLARAEATMVDYAKVYRAECQRAARTKRHQLFAWEERSSDVSSRAAPGLLAEVYPAGRSLYEYTTNKLNTRVVEDAHEADGVRLAARAVDELAREGHPLLTSATVEIMCARVQTFLTATKAVKGLEQLKNKKAFVKQCYDQGDVLSASSTAFERRLLKRVGKKAAT